MSDHEQTLRLLARANEDAAKTLDRRMNWGAEHGKRAADLRNDAAACLSGADALVRAKTLRAALVGMVGTDDPKGLDAMELTIRQSPAPASDKAVAIDAIDALRATREAE